MCMRRTGPIVHWDNCLKLHEALWATRFLQFHTKKDSYLFIAGEIIECQSVAVSAGGGRGYIGFMWRAIVGIALTKERNREKTKEIR